MDATEYTRRTGLTVPVERVEAARVELWRLLDEAKQASMPATPSALNRLYVYPVPRLSADGSCSITDELDDTPYDLAAVLGGRTTTTTLSLMVLDRLVRDVARPAGADWLGVYQARAVAGVPTLVKLVAVGVPSRPEYPLTEAFAARSTNVAVGRSGTARIISDVRAHVAAGGAYYECDPSVQAEACLPLLGPDGKVTGIIDAEARRAGAFDGAAVAWLVALALEVAGQLPEGGL